MGKESRYQSSKDDGTEMAQTAVSLIAVGSTIATVDWKVAFSSAVVAGVISILTSVAGIPEVGCEDE